MEQQPPPTPRKLDCQGRRRPRMQAQSKSRALLAEFAQPSSSQRVEPMEVESGGYSSRATSAVDHMLSLLRDAEANVKVPNLISELKCLLGEALLTVDIEIVASQCDRKGLDLMQRAVVANCYNFVEHLLIKGYHLKSVRRPCDNPLHLACKLGRSRIVQLLMDYGADLTHSSSICYPSVHHHQSIANTPNAQSIPSNPFCAYSSKCSPLCAAMMNDNVDIVRMIMSFDTSRRPKVDMKTLQFACKHGAKQSLAFLVPLAPQEVGKRFSDGNSFLSFAFSKSYACGRVLLENEQIEWPRDILEDCTGKGDSLLHVIYRNCLSENIAQLTRAVFQKGVIRDLVNQQDRNGNTPLHILMKQVGRRVGQSYHFGMMNGMQEDPLSQDTKDEQVFATAALLVNEGADLHARNKINESVVHHLLQDTFYRRLYGMNASYYHGVLPEINRMLEYLLRKGAEVDASSTALSSPLTWLTHILCSMESSEVETTWPEVLYTLRLFLRYGADPNMDDEKGISIICQLLTAVSRWMHQCVQRNELEVACCILKHMNELIELLFSYQLLPSLDVLDLCCKQVAILCNVGVTDRSFLHGVRELLVPFFLNGINPNTVKLVADRFEHSEDSPCPLSAQFYMARAFIIHQQDLGMLPFLSLFEQSLEQMSINHMTQALSSILLTNFKDDQEEAEGGTLKCVRSLQRWSRSPRSLKTLSKVKICGSLQWKLRGRVPVLPLPPVIKRYLTSF